MMPSLLSGTLVRLTAEEPQNLAKAMSGWERDTEYARLLNNDSPIPFSQKKWTEWLEKDLDKDKPEYFSFAIRPLESEKLIGFVGFWDIQWTHETCWVGIGLGERDFWGKGYGTDAMKVGLRFVFQELNLYRVSLIVFGYNERAIRSYTKAGFREEGRLRDSIHREGQRWDDVLMGITRPEWENSH